MVQLEKGDCGTLRCRHAFGSVIRAIVFFISARFQMTEIQAENGVFHTVSTPGSLSFSMILFLSLAFVLTIAGFISATISTVSLVKGRRTWSFASMGLGALAAENLLILFLSPRSYLPAEYLIHQKLNWFGLSVCFQAASLVLFGILLIHILYFIKNRRNDQGHSVCGQNKL